MKNTKLLQALQGNNQGRPPIWLMRQAGRYMPEYQELKKGRLLFDLFHDVEKIVEITLLPVQKLGVDAAILFSDILTVCDGLGKKWGFEEGRGPILPDGVQQGERFQRREAYGSVIKAIEALKRELDVPLLGFAGAPFTVASYLIEGGTSRDLKKTKKWLYTSPETFHEILDQIADETILYLNKQIEAGVNAIQLFDSWAHHLDTPSFEAFSLAYMEKIVKGIKKVPVILFCRGSCFFAEKLARVGAVSLDWSGKIEEIRKKVPHTPLQGNLDPMVLYGSKERIRKEADAILDGMEGDPAFIFNLGHGVLPDIPYDHVKTLVDHVLARNV